MDVKFRAMNSMDYLQLGGCVRTTTRRNAYNALSGCLDSKSLFGTNSKHKSMHKSLARSNMRAYIKLEGPTFNYVLSRSGASLLSKVLGFRQYFFADIAEGKYVMSKTTHQIIHIDSVDEYDEYLYGAEIAKYYIDNLDIEKSILDCLRLAIADEFKGVTVKHPFDVMTVINIKKDNADEVEPDPNGEDVECVMRLPGGYTMHYHYQEIREHFKRNHDIRTLKKVVQDTIFNGHDTRLSYLLNLKDKTPLYGMLNYHIAVVPAEMRPETMERLHPLTNRYAAVINANQDLGAILLEDASPKDIAARYAALNQAVSRLQYKCRELGLKSIKLDDMSLIERMKGKHGHVRLHALGKRQDYSGRAVVIVNPYLPLDVIRIPRQMLPSLLEYHILPYLASNINKHNKETSQNIAHTKMVYNQLKLTNLEHPDAQNEMLRIIENERLMEKIPLFLGRQPTLHKHGIQGFHIEATDAIGIEVNPLVCPAYNMDFDGDTAHVGVPLTDGAIKEVRDLILTTHNLYLPKTGECTIMPRQDMLYGLYILTRKSYKVGTSIRNYQSLAEVREDVIYHRIKAWDTVTCGKYTAIAGELAFMSCFPEGMVLPSNYPANGDQINVTEITNKSISKFVDKLLETDGEGNMKIPLGTRYASTETFTGAINHIVELGFKSARIYTPSMSLILQGNDPYYARKEIEDFHVSMKDIDLYYSYGLETSDNYKLEFDKNLELMQKNIESSIHERLGPDNGYSLLALSGARGGTSNLVQIFAYKGRVKKNSNESFDALLENSYASQLSPLECLIAAYGGRQGQIDKSLNTGKTGYASRQMWHSSDGMNITCSDCGTSEGLKISKEFLSNFCVEESSDGKRKEIQEYFSHAIVGRYMVGTQTMITKERAAELAGDDSVQSVTIRSPLTCRNQCCAKCYGMNWGNHKKVHVGFPAGVIAAQSIGEPATQLTMKEFQKGGVVTKGTLTSAFSKVMNYITVTDMSKRPGYDPVAWEDGTVHETHTSNIAYKKLSIGDNPKTVLVPSDLKVKEKVTKGTGFSYVHGDYDLRELTEYMGIDYAQLYLIFKLYSLYKSECKISMVHFEVLAASMTQHMIINTDREDLRVGQYHTTAELHRGSLRGTQYVSRLLSIKSLPTLSNDALDSINMENHVKGLSRACLLQLNDSMSKPLNRILLGQTIKTIN